MPNTNSLIVYDGPSTIDGKPIVVILTGLDQSSANGKTGDLVQSFIIRSDIAPTDALKTGDDASVCGLCPHRPMLARATGDAPCYVRVGESVLSVYGAYRRGSYARASSVDQVAQLLRGRKLRLGTYGDPAAAPVELWSLLVSLSAGHVGYTHQWQAHGLPLSWRLPIPQTKLARPPLWVCATSGCPSGLTVNPWRSHVPPALRAAVRPSAPIACSAQGRQSKPVPS
jgi:hypothetical protein